MELNPQQQCAVKHNGGHVLVLAGAGTGKTRTIIARTNYLIKNGCNPHRILMVTFTRRAAREMTHRLQTTVGSSAASISVGTFHHFCLAAMRWAPKVFGLERATVIDRDDQKQLFKLVRGHFKVEKHQFPKAATLVDLHSYARNTNQPAHIYLKNFTEYDDETREMILRIFAEYAQRKRRNNYLDYDDILFRFAKCLHEKPTVRRQLQGRFDHILVDELQDTNPLQWLILDGLRDPALLFCVGDDAQSIYSFRGADFQNVHSFKQRVPNSTVMLLEENYRSTQEILDLPNWLLQQSSLNFEKALHASRGSGLKPRLIDFESNYAEAEWITEDLSQRYEAGALWKNHMILTRTGYAARSVEAAMIAKKIPYEFIGGTGLMESAHVKDLFSLVRCSVNHRDELAWIRYLTLWPKIGDTIAHRLIENMKIMNRMEDALKCLRKALQDYDSPSEGVITVFNSRHEPQTAVQQAARVLEPLMEKRYEKWDKRRSDFDLLIRLSQRHKDLSGFLDTYALDPISTTNSTIPPKIEDAVSLITVHSAKGTEAPVCYVIKVEPEMYPHVRSLGKIEEEEEERRILYVAMTRAQNELILTRTLCRKNSTVMFGGSEASHSKEGISYLLENLPTSLVETEVVGFRGETFNFDSDVLNDNVIIPAQ